MKKNGKNIQTHYRDQIKLSIEEKDKFIAENISSIESIKSHKNTITLEQYSRT